MATTTKLSAYTRKAGKSGSQAWSVKPSGGLSSRTMMVMMTAMTPSLNASMRFVPMFLMAEVAHAGEDHGEVQHVGGGDDFVVFH